MQLPKIYYDIMSFLEGLDSKKTLLYSMASCTFLMLVFSFVSYQTQRDSVVGYVLASTLCSLGLNFFGMLSIVNVSYHLIYLFFLTNILIGFFLDFMVTLSFGWFVFVWFNQIFILIMCHIHLRKVASENFHKNPHMPGETDFEVDV